MHYKKKGLPARIELEVPLSVISVLQGVFLFPYTAGSPLDSALR